MPSVYVQEYEVYLELSETSQLLICADNITLLGDRINTLKENTETLLEASRVINLEINSEKSKYMIMCCDRNSG